MFTGNKQDKEKSLLAAWQQAFTDVFASESAPKL
jgi:hypothetical protein